MKLYTKHKGVLREANFHRGGICGPRVGKRTVAQNPIKNVPSNLK